MMVPSRFSRISTIVGCGSLALCMLAGEWQQAALLSASPPPRPANAVDQSGEAHKSETLASGEVKRRASVTTPAVTAQTTEPQELSARIERAVKKTVPATVRIEWEMTVVADGVNYALPSGVSGAIITRDGLVVTCAHHNLRPGTELKVHISDGRTVVGKVLSVHPQYDETKIPPGTDISVVQLLDKGPWPTVECGTSLAIERDERCIVLGHPGNQVNTNNDLLPFVRTVQITDCSAVPETFSTNGRVYAGDSGGPAFNLDGRLIGITSNTSELTPPKLHHVGIDVLLHHWKEMVALKMEPKPVGPGDSRAAMGALSDRQQPAVVEVLCDSRRVALGTVMSSDGMVITKASEISGEIKCKLSDGSEVDAKLVGSDPRHDLALLKLNVAGLTAVSWSNEKEVPLGRVVSAVPPRGGMPAFGGVCYSAREIKADGGGVNVGVKDADQGVEIEKAGADVVLLKVGDIITHVDGVPTPDEKTWVDLILKKKAIGGRPLIGGERLTLTICRAGRTAEIVVRQSQRSNLTPDIPMSDRRSGFPWVFSADLRVSPDLCGGPVIDPTGKVVGINVASANYIETYVLPAHVVKQSFTDLRKSMEIK